MKRYFVLMAAAYFITAPAMARQDTVIACNFVTECLDTDGCADTTFDLTLSFLPTPAGPKGMISQAIKTDVNGSTTGLVASRNQILRYTSGEFFEGPEETLSVNADGDARFVVTMPELPMVITYAGRCAEMDR